MGSERAIHWVTLGRCVSLKGKVLHKLKIKDMRLVIVNPALIFVGLQMEGYEAKHSLSPLLSLPVVCCGGYRSYESPQKSGGS